MLDNFASLNPPFRRCVACQSRCNVPAASYMLVQCNMLELCWSEMQRCIPPSTPVRWAITCWVSSGVCTWASLFCIPWKVFGEAICPCRVSRAWCTHFALPSCTLCCVTVVSASWPVLECRHPSDILPAQIGRFVCFAASQSLRLRSNLNLARGYERASGQTGFRAGGDRSVRTRLS